MSESPWEQMRDRGYEPVSLYRIGDVRLGALCRSIGQLTRMNEVSWRRGNPNPSDSASTEQYKAWQERFRQQRCLHQDLLAKVVAHAIDGDSSEPHVSPKDFVVCRAGEVEPQLLAMHRASYGEDIEDAPAILHRLVSFASFVQTPQGSEITGLAIWAVLGRDPKMERPPAVYSTIDKAFFNPYLSTGL